MGTTTATAGIRFIDVAWSVSNNGGATVQYYHVYKNGAYLGQYTTTSLRDSSVENGVTASYYVFAFNSAGWSAQSNTASATTPSLPSTPGSLTANSSTFGTVGLSWTASSGSGYSVSYIVKRNGTTLATTTSTSYSDNTVAPYTSYTYTVTASTDVGVSSDASVLVTSLGGIVRIWNGSSYVVALPKIWNGTSWVNAQARVWNGTEWKYGI
jgi:mannan endo-1,4-beta-mannosidase